jgi:hypothetical protein
MATEGENTEGMVLVSLSDLPPIIALSSHHGSSVGVSDEPWGGHWCLFPMAGPAAAYCRLPPAMTRARYYSSLMMKRTTSRPSGLDARLVARQHRSRRWPLLP